MAEERPNHARILTPTKSMICWRDMAPRVSFHVILSHTILSHVMLSHVVYHVILSHVILSHVILSHAILSHVILTQAILSHVIFSHVILSHVILSHLMSSHLTGHGHVPLRLDHHRVPPPLPHGPLESVHGVVGLYASPRLPNRVVPRLK